jgi:uncharacterized protein YdaU (DUF1376 family)
MNYFELHIGDYEKATAHLTACEDGIYGRLMRRYYDTEAPLPDDLKALQRFVRARTREEKEAVEAILDEFFQLAADGWHHKRCDEEIARYAAKREKAKRSAEARWSQSERNANAMRTHSEGNADGMLSSHQTPVVNTNSEVTGEDLPPRAYAHVGAVVALRQLGVVDAHPGYTPLQDYFAQGGTLPAITGVAKRALKEGKGRIAYITATARGQLQDGPRASPQVEQQESLEEHNRRVATEWAAQPYTQTEDLLDAP